MIYQLYLSLSFLCVEYFFCKKGQSSLAKISSAKWTSLWDIFAYCITIFEIDRIILHFYSLGGFTLMEQWLRQHYGSLVKLEKTFFYSVLVSIVFDFLNYWIHRFQHTSQWLWIVHKFHHSAEDVTAITWYRSHPLHGFFRAKTLLSVVFGYYVLKTEIFLFHMFLNIFAHSRVDTNLGFVGKYLFITPRTHHKHHSMNDHGVNFSSGLVLWDRIFKTYSPGDTSIYVLTCGIPDSEGRLTSIRETFVNPFIDFVKYPLVKVWKMFSAKPIEPSYDEEDISKVQG